MTDAARVADIEARHAALDVIERDLLLRIGDPCPTCERGDFPKVGFGPPIEGEGEAWRPGTRMSDGAYAQWRALLHWAQAGYPEDARPPGYDGPRYVTCETCAGHTRVNFERDPRWQALEALR